MSTFLIRNPKIETVHMKPFCKRVKSGQMLRRDFVSNFVFWDNSLLSGISQPKRDKWQIYYSKISENKQMALQEDEIFEILNFEYQNNIQKMLFRTTITEL